MIKNMKIGKKLILSFVAVVLIASIAALVGLYCLIKTDKQYSNALVNNGFSQGEIGAFNTYFNKGAALVRDIIFLTDDAQIKSAQDELELCKTLTTENLEKLKISCTTPKEVEYVKIIEDNLVNYKTSRDEVVSLGLANKNVEALALFQNETKPIQDVMMKAAEDLSELNVKLGNEVSKSLSAGTTAVIFIIILVISVSIIISLFIAIYMSRSISKPINSCAKRLLELSQGDLQTPVPEATSKDETGVMLVSLKSTCSFLKEIINDIDENLGKVAKGDLNVNANAEYKGDFVSLRDSMSTIVNSLNDTLSNINQASDEVASGADQVSSGAQELSQGATEQASSVEELAATITEISQQVRDNASSAIDASHLVDSVGSKVTDSNEQMQKLITAMHEISETSSEISKIIKTIEDIAFQTNILALNAAVEAARAGAAGKGFAVVADEVRNLASKSSEAAKNTTALIGGSIIAVQNGTKLVDETAKSLLSVVEGTQGVTVTIDKISNATNEQSNSIAQVTQGVDQISAVVQNNSATAEQSAAASEELSGQAQMLKSLVSKFTLRKKS